MHPLAEGRFARRDRDRRQERQGGRGGRVYNPGSSRAACGAPVVSSPRLFSSSLRSATFRPFSFDAVSSGIAPLRREGGGGGAVEGGGGGGGGGGGDEVEGEGQLLRCSLESLGGAPGP
eukprot:SAG31_NODE_1713_length_7466_cov_4.386182_4_plen_119_part_00